MADLADQNRIMSVIQIQVAKPNAGPVEQSLHPPSLHSQIVSKMSLQGAIMHQISPQRVMSELGNYPMACLPLNMKAIVALQIKYLEMNGIFNIYVVVHQDAANKTRMYLRDHFEADPRSNVYLVVIQEEATETANALKLMCLLQKDQESRLANMPEYEREVLRQAGKRT